jgi:hypothetical protein
LCGTAALEGTHRKGAIARRPALTIAACLTCAC